VETYKTPETAALSACRVYFLLQISRHVASLGCVFGLTTGHAYGCSLTLRKWLLLLPNDKSKMPLGFVRREREINGWGEERFVFQPTRLTNWKVGESYFVRHVRLRSPGLVACWLLIVTDEEMVGQIFSFCTYSHSVLPHVMVPTFLTFSLSDRNRNQNPSIAPSSKLTIIPSE